MNKKISFYVFSCLILILISIVAGERVSAESTNPTVFDVTDFGAVPGSGQEAGDAVREALAAAKSVNGPVVINFPEGTYNFYPENAIKRPYHITNTASETQTPNIKKKIGILIKGMDHVTINGNGSLFLYHGEMTSIVIDNSEDIKVKNVHIDYSRPTTSEMTIKEVGSNYFIADVHEDSLYKIENGQIIWMSEPGPNGKPYWTYTWGNAQVFDPDTNTLRRTWNPTETTTRVKEIDPFLLKFYFDDRPDAQVGQIFTMREDVRDEVGVFIVESKNITFQNVGMNYMHGLGFVFQYSKNLTIINCRFAPRPQSGRIISTFADFIQVSGGRGLVKIIDSYFSGSNDDAINIHGTHLRIVDHPAPNQIIVRFMHPQTYGFDAFFPGNKIDFVHADTLTAYGSAIVTNVQDLSPRKILLTLNHEIPEEYRKNDVVENVTYTPSVIIRGNYFERIPTRGILVTTRREVIIKNNVFNKPQMSAILIADDAQSWYESGMVKDVLITGNTFIKSGNPVIRIHPENDVINPNNPVHQNIRVKNNTFKMPNGMSVEVKSTQGFNFVNNKIFSNQLHFNFNGSSDVTIQDNIFMNENIEKVAELNHSLRRTFQIPKDFQILNYDKLASVHLSTNIGRINRINMSASATSYQDYPYGNSPDKVLDGDSSTIGTASGRLMQNFLSLLQLI